MTPKPTRMMKEAFKQMKKLIAKLPTLTAPRENEELIIYLAAAKEAISAVLMTDREDRQTPVYFVSRTLRGPEVNYTPMEKLVLALLSASKRLKRYFQAHTVVVITNQPMKQLLSSSEISRRMLKWKFELEGYDIQYRLRTAIKGQILADFIVERPEEESPDELMAEPEVLPEPWTLFTDGSSCVDGSGAGLILTNPEGAEFTYAMRFRFDATNNEAEYEALIAGLRIAEKMGIKNLQANVDSKLVANQVNGSYIAKESGIKMEFSIKQIPRSKNKKADALSKIASTSFAHLNKQVLLKELKEKSIEEKEILVIVEEEGNTWMTPICEYLTKEILPEDKKKARAVRRKAAKYAMINGTLYKKSFLGPWLRCVGPLQANYVLREIHEGSCSMHSGPRSVVAKAIQTGYYWPTMHMDARNLIRECNDCQIHRPVPRNPQQNLTPITSPWPFYKWGMDIAGPFPEGPGKVKFLIVAIDYFTKWIEAKAVATITGNQVKKFVWDNIGPVIWPTGSSNGKSHSVDIRHGSRQTRGIRHAKYFAFAEIDKLKTRDEAWNPLGPHRRKKEQSSKYKKQRARKRWKNITTQESAEQVSNRVIWSTVAMKQVMLRTKANLDPSGRDHTKLKSRLERELTNSKTAKEMKCRGHGTFVISKNVIYMKCKNLPGTYDAPKGNIFICIL
ncbi:reverse transcriptase domain-containing protein [Tanacetum coccineum]